MLEGYKASWYAIRMARSAENLTQQNPGEPPKQTTVHERGWSYKGENFKLTYDMQAELARRFFKLPPTVARRELDDAIFRWVDGDKYIKARNFRNFVETHPDVVALFKSDPDAALE